MIRDACEKDCLNLTALSIDVWLDTYARQGISNEHADYVLSTFSAACFREVIANPCYRLLLCEEDGALQGYVLVNLDSRYQREEYGFEIEKLYVLEQCKGRGIGKRLLEQVDKSIGTNYWLYTWVENASNTFYQHLGLSLVGQLSFEFAGQTVVNNVYSRIASEHK